MHINSIRTRLVKPPQDNISDILDKISPKLKEGSIVAIASKIISIHEGRSISVKDEPKKDRLIRQEAQYWLPTKKVGGIGSLRTITQNALVGSAGIDRSNSNDHWILYPEDPFNSAKEIWRYLKKKADIKKLGVIIVDSHSQPLRRGTMGFSISYWGFNPLRKYIGMEDIFGYKFKFTEMNLADGLAASAVLAMGEGDEQTPIVIIEGFSKKIEFNNRDPRSFGHMLSMDEDLFRPILKKVRWRKGKGK